MAINAFTLSAEIKADVTALDRALRGTEQNAENLTKELTATERAAKGIGSTSATTAGQFERLKNVIAQGNQKVNDAAVAFRRGDITAKQMASVINQVGRSSASASNQIKTLTARVHDLNAAQRATKLTAFRSGLLQQQAVRHGRALPGGVMAPALSGQLGNNALLAGITGGIAGAGIAGAGLAAFSITSKLAGGIADLGMESIKVAADFQQTQNAMAVFTGSTEKAKIELKALADLSRKTPGLGLEDAEKGATRLRAMGFSAATATKLLTGLAKQKILSGVGSDAIDRTTLNLAQLASGGGDMQDIKDLVTNLPTSRKIINETFGSLQGFSAALKRDAGGAIEKYAEALSMVQAPAGGFNDALQKLNDSVMVSGRAFGAPILDPLTDGMKNLTAILYSGEAAWSSWGTTVGNQIRAANAAINGLSQIDAATGGRLSSSISALVGQAIRQQLPTVSAVLGLTSSAGSVLGSVPGQAKASIGGSASGFDSSDSKINLEKAKEDAIKLIEIQAAARKENQNQLTSYYGYISNLNSAAFKIQESQLANHLSKQEASEMQSIRANAALKEQQIRAQQRTDAAYFQGALSMAQPGEQGAIRMRANEAFANSNAEIAANAARAAVAIREAMKKVKTDIASIFTGAFQNNPFVGIFEQGRLAIERVREATMGLNPQLRAMLLTLTAGATATAAFGQALENKLLSSNLRNEARQFAAGKLDADTPRNFQENLERQLKAVGATGYAFGRSAQEQRLIDKQVIALTQGIDPSRLTRSQQQLASSARLREAGALDAEQKQAQDIQAKLLVVLQNLEGNKALTIDINDPNSRTSIAATSSNVQARYPAR